MSTLYCRELVTLNLFQGLNNEGMPKQACTLRQEFVDTTLGSHFHNTTTSGIEKEDIPIIIIGYPSRKPKVYVMKKHN